MSPLKVSDVDSPFAAVEDELRLGSAGRHVFQFFRVRVSAFVSNTSGRIDIYIVDNGIGVQISGTISATLQFEASIDGVNFIAAPMVPSGGGAAVTSATAADFWTNTY